jgi:sigma-B regulation protein RsbU (phosphoserine phosphatase)
MLNIEIVATSSLLYITLLFMVAYYADKRREQGRSIISNPYIYSLSIAVYCTSWTFYGSVGKAATTGLDFILIYLGPSLTAFSWWFLLRKIVRITKENNITSIADFISLRYGKSPWLGAIVTAISILGIMPYVALQLRAVSTTFRILCGEPSLTMPGLLGGSHHTFSPAFTAALILSIFSVIFGARHLVSSEQHEGLVAAIAVESIVKLFSFLVVGIFVTYFIFNGFTDIFAQMYEHFPEKLNHLTTVGEEFEVSFPNIFSVLFLSMGAVMFLPRQFHIMVIENSNEEHIKKAMWLFPAYLFAINIFVVPIAFGGLLSSGSNIGADFFVLTLPLQSGHSWIALLAFLGGFSAAAGMVMVESVAISTMFLNNILMPIVVKFTPRSWFPYLLINLKRLGIFLVIFLGYAYHDLVGNSQMLVNMGLISFAAATQFAPALIGGLYWRRGNKSGAIVGIVAGFLTWFYTLLLPSFIKSIFINSSILETGPFGISILKPTELFGLTGFDPWTHSLFWSMFFNIIGYLICSIMLPQAESEKEQVKKFVDVFEPPREEVPWETKRLSKPVTIMQFVNLMAKFIGEAQAYAAIAEYLGEREIDEKGGVSEFELPNLKRFIEKTLAGSVGAAAAGAIVESYLSDIGSKMESVYDIFSTVRTSLDQSREALYVRLRASEIMNRTLDIQIIMEDLLELLLHEFKFDLVVIRLINSENILTVRCFLGSESRSITESNWLPEIDTYIGEAFLSRTPQFVNDTTHISKPKSKEIMDKEGVKSFAHIPIASEGAPPVGILSVFSKKIVGIFTEPFLDLLVSLAGQLAQAVKIVAEREAREQERQEKEKAQLENARVAREMELAKQIQLSLLPAEAPVIPSMLFASRCVPAAQVGGDYYDFFKRSDSIVDMVIADVSGHSVGAALIMVETRTVLRTEAYSSSSPKEVLAALNNVLYEDLGRAELFITMFYAKYDSTSRCLTYATAGHNPPLLFRGDGITCSELDAEGLILGVKQDVSFEEKDIALHPGDLLVLYTDGITEAQNETGELFGVERLRYSITSSFHETPEAIVNSILQKVSDFTRTTTLGDDISLVVVKIA